MSLPFATTTVTRTRTTGTRNTSGRWTPGTPTTAPVLASVQPAGGKDLQRLPEGQRKRDAIAVWTESELIVADQYGTARQQSDRITYKGVVYECQHVEYFDAETTVPHYYAVAVRLDEADA